ncbi:MAG: Stk1 family PASTA domain-containing Ser/Thr kinase [Clostridia bacterium]|nr:Stk1 family PASTA domain-containing Ser/Thr kinase [Clostridia bacterium]
MDNRENLIGKILGERYIVQAIVGEGGMSVVMKALDKLESKEVTIKLLNLNSNSDNTATERFTNEAKAVAMLSHPNIVSVHDVSLDGPDKYIVMEYIDGITLKEYLDKNTRLEWREAVHFIKQVLNALSHAHEKGIIHRDIKPENVMLLKDGSIKVIDFGIAKLPDSKSLTITDKAIGTVNYISPEQASGSASSEKSDIYSTGIMLYELVTGQLPFVSASSVSVAMMHVSSEPAMPTTICDSIPKGLEQIIIKSIMKSPDRRFGSAGAMKKALEYLLLHPVAVFKETPIKDKDGNVITGTGAFQNTGNNTVITSEISSDTENVADRRNNNSSNNKTKGGIISKKTANESYANNEDDEYYSDGQRSSMFPIILGVTLAFFTVAILFAVLAYNKLGMNSMFSNSHRDSADDTLTVPSLVGREYTDDLYVTLSDMGFNVTVTEVSNDNVAIGYIVSQEPLADSTRKKNPKGVGISIEVSAGTSEVVLKDYTHFDSSNVSLELSRLGLEAKIKTEYNDTVISDHVIRTEPVSGTTLIKGDEVTLYVSLGPKDVTVKIPEDIIGLSYREAERLLQSHGITVDNERSYEYSDVYAKNTVISTSPKPGSSVSATKDKVRLILSNGSEPAPEAVETGTTENTPPENVDNTSTQGGSSVTDNSQQSSPDEQGDSANTESSGSETVNDTPTNGNSSASDASPSSPSPTEDTLTDTPA